MKKLLVVLLVLLLVGCTAQAEGVHLSSYTGYVPDGHVNLIEPSSGDYGTTYMRVGNNSVGTAYWAVIPLPSNWPESGDISTASLRLAEYNSTYRGANALTLKISPVTGAWSTSTKWNTFPAYASGVVATYDMSGAAPSSSNYDYRTDYHAAMYKSSRYEGPTSSGPWTLLWSREIEQEAYNTLYEQWGGTSIIVKISETTYWKTVISYTSAYYETYIKYHDINITEVAQYCLDNECTGLLLYFDTAGANDTRRYFKTADNTDSHFLPYITLAYDEVAANPPMFIAASAGSIDKQVVALQITLDGTTWKSVAGMMIAPTQGSIDKTVF